MEKDALSSKAMLIEGARRIGKLTIVEEFAKKIIKVASFKVESMKRFIEKYITKISKSYIIHPKKSFYKG